MSKTLSNLVRDPGPLRTWLSQGLVLFVAASAPLWLIPGAMAQAPQTQSQIGSWSPPVHDAERRRPRPRPPDRQGAVLGRRELGQGLDTPDTTPHLWDPVTGQFDLPSPPPTPKHNIFCSGHAFLPDGRLLVAGGAIVDGDGLKNASLYDPVGNDWTAVDDMNAGRWYPTVLALANGDMLVASGSFKTFPLPGRQPGVNDLPQVLGTDGHWRDVKGLQPLPPPNNMMNEPVFPLYPFLHVAPDGNVFMSGPLVKTSLVDVVNGTMVNTFKHATNPTTSKLVGERDFGSSVMYDVGKVLVVGGHMDPPTATAEVIDLNDASPAWRFVGSMSIPRRQLNATLLADGKVLVIGGTNGSGHGDRNNDDDNFNDLSTPVFPAELWDPAHDDHWTVMASASVPRQYHSTSVLLPDATVCTRGRGEYAHADPATGPNNHRDAQIYSPPYLFNDKGPAPRPVISSAPDSVSYGADFQVGTPAPGDIKRVTWVRLSSVTHAYDQNQRFNNLAFRVGATDLQVTAPPDGNHAPPGALHAVPPRRQRCAVGGQDHQDQQVKLS